MGKPNKDFNLSVIDGDILAYRCAVSSQDEHVNVCYQRLDDLMGYCLDQTLGFYSEENYKVFLTGSNNFRYEIAKAFPYKGNRSDKVKPQHLEYARVHLEYTWGAVVVDGAEADDAIAWTAYSDPDSVVVSIDKDFHTVPGWKYNFVKDEWFYDSEWDALNYFYGQVLTGDNADNIKGLFRVGPVKAKKILDGCKTEQELFQKCLEAYDGDYDRVVENARLLHLQRREGELWHPPTQ